MIGRFAFWFAVRMFGFWPSVGVAAGLVVARGGQGDESIRPIADNPRLWSTDLSERGPQQFTHVAVRDSTTWVKLWSDPVANRRDSAPPVDFQRYTVLVFAD